ncbi:MAG: hypothetical protein IJV15_12380 [Lachnospiraceae bacterium]|nr:hypothetical protein [Lachnospiraceae bacterium]
MGKIRDFFFPTIDKLSKEEEWEENKRKNRIEQEIKKYQFQDNEVDLMLKFADEYEKREDARLHEVESKAIVFIGTFSVAVTILVNLLKEFMPGSSSGFLTTVPTWLGIVIPFLLGLAIFYLCFAIINSVKALQRNTFNVLGVRETLNAGYNVSIILEASKAKNVIETWDYADYKKAEIARKKFLYTFKNENVINRKVEYMTLAQEFFLHAVVVLIMMVLLLALFIFWQKVGSHVIDIWNKITALLKSLVLKCEGSGTVK